MGPEGEGLEPVGVGDHAVHVAVVHRRVGRDAHPQPVQHQHVGVILGPSGKKENTSLILNSFYLDLD